MKQRRPEALPGLLAQAAEHQLFHHLFITFLPHREAQCALGRDQHSCAVAGPNSSFFQGGQTAALSSGYAGIHSTWQFVLGLGQSWPYLSLNFWGNQNFGGNLGASPSSGLLHLARIKMYYEATDYTV